MEMVKTNAQEFMNALRLARQTEENVRVYILGISLIIEVAGRKVYDKTIQAHNVMCSYLAVYDYEIGKSGYIPNTLRELNTCYR